MEAGGRGNEGGKWDEGVRGMGAGESGGKVREGDGCRRMKRMRERDGSGRDGDEKREVGDGEQCGGMSRNY